MAVTLTFNVKTEQVGRIKAALNSVLPQAHGEPNTAYFARYVRSCVVGAVAQFEARAWSQANAPVESDFFEV